MTPDPMQTRTVSKLEGKVAFIGGAGAGIAKAAAIVFAPEGAATDCRKSTYPEVI